MRDLHQGSVMVGLRRSATLAAVLVLVLVGGCSSTAPPAAAEEQLDSLRVVDRPPSSADYRRSAFGTAWADTDHDGCSQRRDALAASVDRTRSFTEQRRGSCEHVVVAGTWIDPYTGQDLAFTDLTDTRQAEQIPIDHVVALALAYRYGASAWTAERRLAFATDLTNLQPTSRATNLSKSDRDPLSLEAARAVPVRVRHPLRRREGQVRAARRRGREERPARHARHLSWTEVLMSTRGAPVNPPRTPHRWLGRAARARARSRRRCWSAEGRCGRCRPGRAAAGCSCAARRRGTGT